MKIHSFLLCGVAALGIAACGGDDEVTADASVSYDASATPDATPPAPTLDEICNETDGIYIDFFTTLFDCQEGFLELLTGMGLPTTAELSDLCEGALGPYIEDGTVTLGDRAAFDACKAYVDALDCSTADFDVPNPCDDLLVGTIPEGGDCDSSDQCAGDRYCRDGAGTCGKCAGKIVDGEECDDNSQCANGYCREVDGAADVCDTYAAIGEDCTKSPDCLGNSVCDPATDKCVAAPASWSVDDPCSTFIWDCGGPGADLYCHPATETCKEWLAIDDACEQTMLPADFCSLWDYDSCQGPGGSATCTAPTIATNPGDACGFFSGSKCDTGMICDMDAGVCKTILDVGGDCSVANTTCGLFVSCVDGTCQYGEHTGMCSGT